MAAAANEKDAPANAGALAYLASKPDKEDKDEDGVETDTDVKYNDEHDDDEKVPKQTRTERVMSDEEKRKAKRKKTMRKRAKMIKLERNEKIPRDVYSWFEITLNHVNVPTQTFECSIEMHLFWQDFTLTTAIPDPDVQDFRLHESCLPFKMSEIFENKLSVDFEGPPDYKYLKDTGKCASLLSSLISLFLFSLSLSLCVAFVVSIRT